MYTPVALLKVIGTAVLNALGGGVAAVLPVLRPGRDNPRLDQCAAVVVDEAGSVLRSQSSTS
jgi:hypothetical protein